MTAAMWSEVHVGDAVRGADQRPWTVVEASFPAPMVVAGRFGRFVLADANGRQLRVLRPLSSPCELVTQTDTTPERDAAQTLLDAGIGVALIEETTTPVTTVEQPTGEPKRDRWGRYLLPDPTTGSEKPYTRATTISRAIADEHNLTLWKMRMVAKGVALRPDLIAAAAAADVDEEKGALNRIAEQAMERAGAGAGANLGAALHSFTARFDLGKLDPTEVPESLRPDMAAYVDTMRRHRLHVEHVERIVICPELGVAGTFDRVVRQPAGEAKAAPLTVLDLKTGRDLSYGWLEIAMQLSIYAHATAMWNAAAGCYEPMPEVDTDRALVLHLPVGQAKPTLYAVDLIKGWRAVQLAMSVRDARGHGRSMSWLVEPQPVDLVAHNVSRAESREQLARLWELHHPRGEWTDEVQAAAVARLAELEPSAA